LTATAAQPGPVTIGVDTHKDRHVAAAVDQLGRVLGTISLPATAAGYRALAGWVQSYGVSVASASKAPARTAPG
jgi:hypothetical protein